MSNNLQSVRLKLDHAWSILRKYKATKHQPLMIRVVEALITDCEKIIGEIR